MSSRASFKGCWRRPKPWRLPNMHANWREALAECRFPWACVMLKDMVELHWVWSMILLLSNQCLKGGNADCVALAGRIGLHLQDPQPHGWSQGATWWLDPIAEASSLWDHQLQPIDKGSQVGEQPLWVRVACTTCVKSLFMHEREGDGENLPFEPSRCEDNARWCVLAQCCNWVLLVWCQMPFEPSVGRSFVMLNWVLLLGYWGACVVADIIKNESQTMWAIICCKTTSGGSIVVLVSVQVHHSKVHFIAFLILPKQIRVKQREGSWQHHLLWGQLSTLLLGVVWPLQCKLHDCWGASKGWLWYL